MKRIIVILSLSVLVSFSLYAQEETSPFKFHRDNYYQHEYGHYLQSQKYGLAYLSGIGLASLKSAKNHNENNPHSKQPYELDANIRAYNYFISNIIGYDDWNFDRNPFFSVNNIANVDNRWFHYLAGYLIVPIETYLCTYYVKPLEFFSPQKPFLLP